MTRIPPAFQARPTVDRIWSVFEAPIAGTPLTLAKLIVAVALLIALVWLTGKLTRWLAHGVLRRRGVDPGSTEEIATLVRYLLTALGVVIILQAVIGVNLTTIVGLLAGIGVGLGFGLQNIVSNFFSGLILLFERPIKVGEKVRVGEAVGTVRRIAIRATTIIADDNTAIIIPNSDFIPQRVTNWRRPSRGSDALAERAAALLSAQASELGDTGLLLAAVPDDDPLPAAQLTRYAKLAHEIGFVGVLGGGAADHAEGLRGGPLPAGDPLRGTWTEVALGPGYGACFVARRDDGGVWRFAISYDHETVVECAVVLMARMPSLAAVA